MSDWDQQLTEALCTWGASHAQWLAVVTAAGNPLPVTLLAVASVCLALVRRDAAVAVVLLLVPYAAAVSTNLIKDWVHRPRPQLPCATLTATGYSFPSGHAVGATVGFVLPVLYLCTLAVRARWLLIPAILVAGLVAWSRAMLGVHYFVDVLVGQLLAVAWLAVSLFLVWWIKRRRSAYVLGATCIVRDDAGQVLLIRRRVPQRWELPGGLVNRGEAFHDAAVRETLEETGVQVEVQGLVGVYQHPSRRILAGIFVATAVSGEPQPSGEASVVEWVDVETALARLHPLYRPRLEDALAAGGSAPLRVHEGTEVLALLRSEGSGSSLWTDGKPTGSSL